MRIRRLLLAVTVAAFVTSPGWAPAATPCASYSVTAAGSTRSGTQCSPVGTQYSNPFNYWQCSGVPPAGVRVCAGVNLYTP